MNYNKAHKVNPQKKGSKKLAKNLEFLESKIKKYSSDYIFHEAVGSYLLLLMNGVLNAMPSETPLAHKIPEEIENMRTKINEYTIRLQDILDGKNEDSKSELDHCINLRKKLTHAYGAIYRYYALWNLTSSSLNDEVAIRKYREENVSSKTIEFDLFYRDCIEFLTLADNPSKQKSYMGQLLKCIPFKMTRDTFYSLLEKSLASTFDQESEQEISFALDSFRHTIAPDVFSDFGECFSDIANWLLEKKNLKPSTLSDEELEEEYSDFNSVFESLTKIESVYSSIFDDLNSLIILFYLNFSFQDLTEKNFIYKDLYHSVCELLEKETEGVDFESFTNRVYDLLEEQTEQAIDQANQSNKQEYELLQKIENLNTLSEDTLKILASETFVREHYYADINEELFQFQSDPTMPSASDSFRQQKFDEFLCFVKEYFSSQPTLFRKASMRMLLSSLPPVYSIDQILEMIRMAIEEAPSFEHKVLIVDKIGMVFADNGFSYKTGEEIFSHDSHCNCGHEHHHHDSSCDCGHDHHHHDSDCDCGHEHH